MFGKINRFSQNLRIVFALSVALFFTISAGNNFFLGNSPKINSFLFQLVPTPTQTPEVVNIVPTAQVQIFSTPKPSSKPKITQIILSPAKKPTPTLVKPQISPSPTSAPAIACPTSSNQNYGSIATNSDYNFSGPAENQPEINLAMRSYQKVNEKAGLIDYGGDTDPLALKINSLFADERMPQVASTYKVFAWDYSNNQRSSQTENAWPVSLIGLASKPGESLVVPPSGREIGDGNTLMVLYADANRITFTNSVGDNWTDGYILHVEDICTDVNLISAYQNANSSGRGSLPSLPKGKIFGTARLGEVKVAIRDSAQFMDPRSRKDWW